MSSIKVVVPSEAPGGLDAAPCRHFGLCSMFTAASLENNRISSVTIHKNEHILCRDCFAPIKYLLGNGMDVLLVNRLGVFPFRILESIGISVYYFSEQKSVRELIEDFICGKLRSFTHEDTCNGECES